MGNFYIAAMKSLAYVYMLLLLLNSSICNCQDNIYQKGPKSGVTIHKRIYPVTLPGIEPGVSHELGRYRAARIKKTAYTLRFNIPARVEKPISASEEIRFEWASPSLHPGGFLQLDFRDSAEAVRELEVNGIPVPVLLRREHLLVPLALLKPGGNTLHIDFIAGNLSLNRNPDFLYTLLVPDRARTLFPCFDQPDLKAVFTLTLSFPKDWKALANAPVKDSLEEGDTRTYAFLPSDTIPTYLFSFAAGQFRELSCDSGLPMRFYFRETDSAKLKTSLDSIFSIHRQAIRFMEEYTGIPFPFRKFDFIAIPDFQFGGMEHPGAIQYKASSLFLPRGATKNQLIARSNLLSHETAHIWFGDLATMRWFEDVWMKEVFANFFADTIGNGTLPEENFALKFLTDHLPAAYSVDRTAGTHPIRQRLANLQDAGSLYGNIIYNKAPVMMRQLEELMGAGAFREGLREYLHRYSYGNASWPELIRIMDAHTAKDLRKWDQAWIENAGRPEFTCRITAAKGRIRRLTLYQKAADGRPLSWPQSFEIALVYPDHTETLPLYIDRAVCRVRDAEGRPLPRYLVFNAGGEGYGLFPADERRANELLTLPDPLMRASAYINLYENMLTGRSIRPQALLSLDTLGLKAEKEELNLDLLLDQLQSVYWRFISPGDRRSWAAPLEKALWQAIQETGNANIKKLLFKTFSQIALDREAGDSVYAVWKFQKPPAGVLLSEDDYTALATGLALRSYPGWRELLQEQMTRIQNPDNRRRLEFLLPSLSDDPAERDRFFASLKSAQNRQKESWVLSALVNLHHPARGGASEKYLPESLALLEEVHATGGVFFPQNWLQASLGYYQSPEAAAIVRKFLADHPRYDPALKKKILQSADNLFRAAALIASSGTSRKK